MDHVSPEEQKELLNTLQKRFSDHPERHPSIEWTDVEAKLKQNSHKLRAIAEMERTGGEPDVIDVENEHFVFCDCSKESPTGRRSLCYDEQALEARKKNKPSGSAVAMAKQIGIELLDETMYRHLQTLGTFDLKTSSWAKTPEAIRQKGGALFCDRRYDHVFVYHNGADSYYAARGFRGMLYV